MGIFDVSLQIAYGEGGERAFCRLIEAILQGGSCSVFNWHGECADHHSSLAIPRSPQNFAGEPFTPVDWSAEPLEMTMTSLGLRVPLVVFPLLVTSFTSRGVSWAPMSDVSAECLLCPSIKINFQCVSGDPNTAHYALGIVDYLLESGVQPQIRGKSTCFILRRERQYNWRSISVCEPKREDFVGLKTISPPEHGYSSQFFMLVVDT
ncbi:hypothetical protein AZE42_08228 [Rhizopogon vesiculosus]|uniref:Uncharacterized protein n=1 Tax=Rhizopogon vesiculosus TaxID=180088 RepID=A0A1J8Q1W7_9AGAM|nr:hypothetical protein AZE42_08228 [Rhizopogon vesiculosus]